MTRRGRPGEALVQDTLDRSRSDRVGAANCQGEAIRIGRVERQQGGRDTTGENADAQPRCWSVRVLVGAPPVRQGLEKVVGEPQARRERDDRQPVLDDSGNHGGQKINYRNDNVDDGCHQKKEADDRGQDTEEQPSQTSPDTAGRRTAGNR